MTYSTGTEVSCTAQGVARESASDTPPVSNLDHIHKSYGTTSDGVTVFSNAAIMDEGYDNLNAPNVLSLTVLAD